MFDNGFEELKEFDTHKNIITIFSKKYNIKGYIAVHRASSRIPSFGATRVIDYQKDIDAVNDVLRLAKLMSYKSAMAELPYGGAKAVLTSIDKSKDAFKEYGRIISSLRGLFVTGADMGVSVSDVKQMRKTSQYIVGSTSNPVRYTVEGVYIALLASLNFTNINQTNLKVAIQGLGATGSGLLAKVSEIADTVYVADLDALKVKKALKFKNVIAVSPNEIFEKEVDVIMPCALGNSINKKNINSIKASIVCGSANNQLESVKIGSMLHRKKILYAPDYVINAGGLIAVADEYENNNHRVKRVQYKIKVIKKNINKIYAKSKFHNRPTNIVSDKIAESRFNGIA